MIHPFEIIPLSNFTWTGSRDASAIVSAARLVAGFYDLDQLFVRDGRVIFRTPAKGSTTSGSEYPRSELREQIKPGSNSVNWKLSGEHRMAATCAVNVLPPSKKVIIGQIHGKDGSSLPLAKLFHRKGNLWLDVKKGPKASDDQKFDFGPAKLKVLFGYQFGVLNGKLTVTIRGKSKEIDLLKLGWSLTAQTFYFKAGCYCIDNDGEGFAETAFWSLERSHAT